MFLSMVPVTFRLAFRVPMPAGRAGYPEKDQEPGSRGDKMLTAKGEFIIRNRT